MGHKIRAWRRAVKTDIGRVVHGFLLTWLSLKRCRHEQVLLVCIINWELPVLIDAFCFLSHSDMWSHVIPPFLPNATLPFATTILLSSHVSATSPPHPLIAASTIAAANSSTLIQFPSPISHPTISRGLFIVDCITKPDFTIRICHNGLLDVRDRRWDSVSP
jgi:hypothetical protein